MHGGGTRSPCAWCMTVSAPRGGRHPPSPSAPASTAASSGTPWRASPARRGPALRHLGAHLLHRPAPPAWPASAPRSPRGSASPRRIEQDGGEAPRAPGRCAARLPGGEAPARPAPPPSQARAMRWLSEGRSRAAVRGSAAASLACSAAGPSSASRRRASARAAAGDGRDVGQPPGQGGDIHPVPAAQHRQAPAARAAAISASAAPPPHATEAASRRRPHAIEAMRRRASSSGVGRAVITRSSR